MDPRPQLELSVWQSAPQWVVGLRGELDLRTAADLRELLLDLTSTGHHHILLDLSDLAFIDSAGLGVLIGGLRRARDHGGDLELAAPSPAVRLVLDVGGLSGVFQVRAAPPDRGGG